MVRWLDEAVEDLARMDEAPYDTCVPDSVYNKIGSVIALLENDLAFRDDDYEPEAEYQTN